MRATRNIYFFFPILFLFITLSASAQTQEVIVKTIGRPKQPGKVLQGVEVRVLGGQENTYITDANGISKIIIRHKMDGDSFTFLSIEKDGYELQDQGILNRGSVFSTKVPLFILMVDSDQLAKDKKRIEDNAKRRASNEYKKKKIKIEKQLKANKITEEGKKHELEELERQYEQYRFLVSKLADHYARTDYDKLDSTEQVINNCIENGEYEKADSLLRTLTNPQIVVEENTAAKKEIMNRMDFYQDVLDRCSSERREIIKNQESAKKYSEDFKALAEEYKAIGEIDKSIDCLEKALKIDIILYGEDSEQAKQTRQAINTLRR